MNTTEIDTNVERTSERLLKISEGIITKFGTEELEETGETNVEPCAKVDKLLSNLLKVERRLDRVNVQLYNLFDLPPRVKD